jgi:hypothetical protein
MDMRYDDKIIDRDAETKLSFISQALAWWLGGI